MPGPFFPKKEAAGVAAGCTHALVESFPVKDKGLCFCVLVMGEDETGPYVVFAANAKREDMVESISEFLAELKAGTGTDGKP